MDRIVLPSQGNLRDCRAHEFLNFHWCDLIVFRAVSELPVRAVTCMSESRIIRAQFEAFQMKSIKPRRACLKDIFSPKP